MIATESPRRSVRIIRQNLFWAFSYNTVGIALAAAGWLNPAWAAAAMVVSSLLVVGNSLRLQADPSGSLAESDNRDRPTSVLVEDATQTEVESGELLAPLNAS